MTLYQYLIRTPEDIYVLSMPTSVKLKINDNAYVLGERGEILKVIEVIVDL